MSSEKSLAQAMVLLGDSIVAALASSWPRSAAALEARRLVADGYPAGEPCDVYFLVSFDEAVPEDALAAIRAAGFSVREPAQAGEFATIRARLTLGAYDLTMTGARLERIVARFGGFSTLIGAARPVSDESARPVRAGPVNLDVRVG
ncbi:MAG: hypothetical protein ACJ79K_13720 [Gemmatimonadaceae bacterium]